MASADLDCSGSAGGCSGTARSAASGSDGPSTVNGGVGARGPPAGESSSTGSCSTSESGCQASTSSTAGSGQVVADVISESQQDSAEQAAQDAEQAGRDAEQALEVAARPGATAEEKKAATEAATTAQQAQTAAKAAAELAAKPVTDAPATLAESGSSAQCAGGEGPCTAATTGDATVTAALGREKDPAGTSTSHSAGECRSAGAGCATSSTATATTDRTTGMRSGDKPDSPLVPGRSGSTQAGSTIDCPDAGCSGEVTGDSVAGASPDGGSAAAIRAATQAGKAGKGNGAGTDPVSLSTAHGEASCTGQQGGCQAGITTAAGVTVHPGTGATATGRFGTTSASVSADCQSGSGACPTTTRSTSTGTDDPAVLAPTHRSGKAAATGRTSTAVATSQCSGTGPCDSATNGYAGDGVAEVAATCAGTACRTSIQGEARYGDNTAGNAASTRSTCTAGADGACQGTGRVGANAGGAEVSSSCAATEGSDCAYRFSSRSSASDRSGGSSASAEARCGASGGSGSGWCGTSAVAQAAGGGAMAAAACQGSKGSGCHYSYRASSSASAGGGAARAHAAGHGSGTTGAGQVATSATAQAGDGSAQAAASCQGSDGTHCGYSYSARLAASAPGAHADASGSGSGGMGSGWVAVTAQADSGVAPDGTKYASASASCYGSAGTSCSHHYEASRSAFAGDPKKSTTKSWAQAYAHGSGGGGMGGGGVSVAVRAYVKGNHAEASATCSGAANCVAPFTAHGADSARGTDTDPETGRQRVWDAQHWVECSGSNGGCGVTAHAVAGPKGGKTGGWGECTTGKSWPGFREGGTNTYVLVGPAPGAAGQNGKPKTYKSVKEAEKAAKSLKGKQRTVLAVKEKDGDVALIIRKEDGTVLTDRCTGRECDSGLEVGDEKDGQHAEYDPHATDPAKRFTGSNPSGKGKATDWAESNNGFTLARDEHGNGTGSVTGKGRIHDGYSNSTVTYTRSTPHKQQTNSVTFAGPSGNGFQTTCYGGCVGDARQPGKPNVVDHFEFTGSSKLITGRDEAGHAFTVDATDPSFFGVNGQPTRGRVDTAEGDHMQFGYNDLFDVQDVYQSDVRAGKDTEIRSRDAFGNRGVSTCPRACPPGCSSRKARSSTTRSGTTGLSLPTPTTRARSTTGR